MKGEIRERVLEALRTAVRVNGAVRLVSPADATMPRGLFADRGEADKPAVRAWVARFFEMERRSGNEARMVRVNGAGLDFLIGNTAVEERAVLICEASPLYQRELVAAWAHLGHSAELQACIEDLASHFHVLDERPRPGEAIRGGADAATFRRDLARELVLSWKYCEHPEAREGIARALRCAQVTQVGKVGERTGFIGRLHLSDEAVFDGDPVEVVEPGWVLESGQGEYLLEKARVRPNGGPP